MQACAIDLGFFTFYAKGLLIKAFADLMGAEVPYGPNILFNFSSRIVKYLVYLNEATNV